MIKHIEDDKNINFNDKILYYAGDDKDLMDYKFIDVYINGGISYSIVFAYIRVSNEIINTNIYITNTYPEDTSALFKVNSKDSREKLKEIYNALEDEINLRHYYRCIYKPKKPVINTDFDIVEGFTLRNLKHFSKMIKEYLNL